MFEQQASDIIDGSSEAVKLLEKHGYEFFTIKKNFYFGEGVFAKIASLTLRTLFGEQSDFVEIKKFKKVFYDMILAVPKKN